MSRVFAKFEEITSGVASGGPTEDPAGKARSPTDVVRSVLLSLLDRSRTRADEPAGRALDHTLQRARWAEEVGYERFWVAEHHGVPGVASGAPAVLVAALGAATSRIRLGSGGVMLPHHQPFVVAEQFRMLEALHPGRIEIGVGRSLGFTEPVRRALRHPDTEPDTFASDVAELRSYLDDTGPVTAQPADGGPVPLAVLATGRGLAIAAHLGLPVVIGGPSLHSDEGIAAIRAYRRGFRPGRDGDRARVTIAFDAFVADDVATARRLAISEAWAMARSRQSGAFEPLRPPADVVADLAAGRGGSQVRRRVGEAVDRTIAGTAGEVRAEVERLAQRTGADEVMLSSSVYDRTALRALDADLFAALV